MKLLNEFYNKSCKPGYESYKKISNNITLIDNFFENFKSAKKFFIGRDKWECSAYQGHSKHGYESYFPKWVGKSLIEKFVLDNKLIDFNTDDINVIILWMKNQYGALYNSYYYPHIDGFKDNDYLRYICLVNLNDSPVSTNFFTYKNKEYCSSETSAEFEEYTLHITDELRNYYGKGKITKNEVKTFLDNKRDLHVKFNKKIEYKPNQPIVYPVNLFHSPGITQEFTKDNP